MGAYTATNLARRASPYGLAVVPETDHYEYTDPRNEMAVQQRWQGLCEQRGATVLGIRDVPTSKIRIQLDGMPWDLEPMGSAERAVQVDVLQRLRELEADNVPFHYWLWGEEVPERPHVYVAPEPSVPARVGPSGIVPFGTTQWDPLLIGVIPTAPRRGLWIMVGKWLH